eukprot:m.16286 g.16286  ORF g.16286 m.16286 type:complete len:306 (+) comp10972_c0_seq1:104-1021(+)
MATYAVAAPYTRLTEYELQRTSQTAGAGETIIELPFFELMDQLKCPICLSILTETMTTKDCLHRFCNECISKCLQVKKECPTCRKKIPSHRHLRRDENFDRLVSTLYPDQSVLEQRELEILEKIKQVSSQTAFQESYEEGCKSQDQNKKKYRLGPRMTATLIAPPPPTPPIDTQERAVKRQKKQATQQQDVSSKSKETLIELQLQPHPSDSHAIALERPCIVTPANCTLAHLKDYLGQVLHKLPRGPSLKDVQSYNFSTLIDGKGYTKQKLTSTMHQVLTQRLPQDRTNRLILFYSSTHAPPLKN